MKSDGQSKVEKLFEFGSPEFKEKWYEIMWGKDGKSGAMKEPYADKLLELLPDGVRLLDKLKENKNE